MLSRVLIETFLWKPRRYARQAKGTPAYTVDDPTIFTRPFTVAVPMRRNDEPMFEYACHEGNYGLLNILRGARAQEAQEQ